MEKKGKKLQPQMRIRQEGLCVSKEKMVFEVSLFFLWADDSDPHSPLPPSPLADAELFTAYIVLPFPECPAVGIIQYVVFQIGFFY